LLLSRSDGYASAKCFWRNERGGPRSFCRTLSFAGVTLGYAGGRAGPSVSALGGGGQRLRSWTDDECAVQAKPAALAEERIDRHLDASLRCGHTTVGFGRVCDASDREQTLDSLCEEA
jgi:hypothetical protein